MLVLALLFVLACFFVYLALGLLPFDLAPMAVDRFGSRYRDLSSLRRAAEANYASFGRAYLWI